MARVSISGANLTIPGTLGVTGVTTLVDDLIGGASTDIAINTNKFTVAASSGNTLVAGTLSVTGASTLTGLLTANGGLAGGSSANIAINTNKFTVAASSGNTLVAGTLAVTGVASLNGGVVIPTSTPATEGAAGTAGTVAWDASYIYVCTTTNHWKRAAIATW